MPRSVSEWIGKTDDEAIPSRVMLRVLDRYDGHCRCGCGRHIAPGESWVVDHIQALINGGEHRENNLQPLLTEHHKLKNAQDMAIKSKNYQRRKKHLGLHQPKRPMPGGRDSDWKKTFRRGWVKR